MADVIDFAAAFDKRHGPDPEFRSQDAYGRPLYTYHLSYEMDGKEYGTQVIAYSMEDAAARVEAMRASLRLEGQLFSIIPG